jgi:hypothetical protein
MLPSWDPNRLVSKIPFNLALIGGRRMGKSSAISDILMRMRDKFDLIVAFIGSASCNPVLEEMMRQYWDERFFFPKWEERLVESLLEQQEQLKKQGLKRSVLILMDDVVLTSDADEQLAHMAMRGRHFNISLAMCSVSYTSLPKRARRSLDCVLVFSLPMQSDLKVLTWEYTQNAKMARFALSHLEDFECLVLETLQKKQKLFTWRADLVTVSSGKILRNQASPECEISKTPDFSATREECPRTEHREGTVDVQDRIQSWERRSGDVSE